MSTRLCGQSRPGATEFDRLNDRARDMRTQEFSRLWRKVFAWFRRQTQDGIDPRLYAGKVHTLQRSPF